jgi:hypothetical protein
MFQDRHIPPTLLLTSEDTVLARRLQRTAVPRTAAPSGSSVSPRHVLPHPWDRIVCGPYNSPDEQPENAWRSENSSGCSWLKPA